MTDFQGYRKVGNRIITEKQYQDEQNSAELAAIATKYWWLTLPAAITAAVGTFFYLSWKGWFLKLLVSFLIGSLVFFYLFPAIGLAILLTIGYAIYSMGGLG